MSDVIDFDNLRRLPGYARLTGKGVDYFEHVLASPPARSVGETSLLSVSGAYATNKFPHMKEYESGGCEKPYILLSVLDRRIVDILPQPKELAVVRHDKLGRRRPGDYVPDYLECGEGRFCIVESKTLRDLKTNLTKYSTDWVRSAGGTFQYLPGQEAAQELGMDFKIFCPDDYPKSYLVNLQYLNRIPSTDLVAEQPKLLKHVLQILNGRPQTLGQLCERFDGLTGGYLYHALIQRKLFGLIESQHFDINFVLFATSLEAEQQSAHLQGLKLPSEATFGPMHKRLLSSSKKEMQLAIAAEQRYDARRSRLEAKDATDYRDVTQQGKAQLEDAPRLAAFVRRVGDRGGSGPCLDKGVRDEIVKHARLYFMNNGVPKLSKLRADYKVSADEHGLYFPARETYRRIIRSEIAIEQVAFMTGGKRAFYAAKPMTDGRDANPRLEIAGLMVHIDGVYGDVRSKLDEDAMYLRPIFYPMIDDATGKVLGRGIKIGRPSRLAVAMSFRDCYQRNGFLPACIYHDWGSELVNHFVSEACAYFHMGYERRPAGAARFGGLGESFNAQFSAFLQTLTGGTYFDKAGRAADGKKKSRSTASLTIAEIIRAADKWMFEVWNNAPIGAERKSPNERFAESYRCFPDAVVKVVDNLLARYHTSFPINVKKFEHRRGFRFGGARFMSEQLPSLLRRGERPTKPRLDTMDPSIVIALTDKGPISMQCLEENRIQGLDFGLRMEELSKLLQYSSTSQSNQFDRNVAEARLRRDSKKVANAISPEAPPTPVPESKSNAVPDFSSVAGKAKVKLERLGS